MKQILEVSKKTLRALPSKSRYVILALFIFLGLLAVLDVFSLTLLSQTLQGASSQSLFQKWPSLALIGLMLVLKNILSALGSLYAQRKFESYEKFIGDRNLDSYQKLSWSIKSQYSESDLLNFADKAPYAAIQGVLFSTVLFAVEGLAAISILVTLFLSNGVVALAITLYFLFIFLVQNMAYGKFTSSLGARTLRYSDQSQALLFDFFRLGKLSEIYPTDFLFKEFFSVRDKLIPARSSQRFIESMPRYYVEAILVVGVGVVSGAAFLIQGADAVFSALIIFAAGGYRLLPMLGRFQGSLSFARMNLDLAEQCFSLNSLEPRLGLASNESGYPNSIVFKSVSFRYPKSTEMALEDFSFAFKAGRKYALVGPSGSGKTTIADLSLGIWDATLGEVHLPAGIRVAYVPQENHMLHGSLEKNISFKGLNETDQSSFEKALTRSNVDLPNMESRSNDDLTKINLSGGQKQRIGLARAFYREFDLLVLDEATSSLDNVNEHEIMSLLGNPNPNQIFLIIAHRLSTIVDADEILYIKDGRLNKSGTWAELMAAVPEFRRQVELGDVIGDNRHP